MTWNEHAASLSSDDHRRIVLAVVTSLHEVRLAAETVSQQGDLEEVRAHLDLALMWLTDARCRLRNG